MLWSVHRAHLWAPYPRTSRAHAFPFAGDQLSCPKPGTTPAQLRALKRNSSSSRAKLAGSRTSSDLRKSISEGLRGCANQLEAPE